MLHFKTLPCGRMSWRRRTRSRASVQRCAPTITLTVMFQHFLPNLCCLISLVRALPAICCPARHCVLLWRTAAATACVAGKVPIRARRVPSHVSGPANHTAIACSYAAPEMLSLFAKQQIGPKVDGTAAFAACAERRPC